MEPIISYFIRSLLSSGVLTFIYWVTLRNSSFHSYNRFYIIFVFVISSVFPLLHFNVHLWGSGNMAYGAIELLPPGACVNFPLASADNEWKWCLYLFIAPVSFVLLLMQLSSILKIYKIRKKHIVSRKDGYNLIKTDLPQAPFVFLNDLFWRTDISLTSAVGNRIFTHELAHIRGYHTHDKLISQILVCVFWFNPFYWILQRELKTVHEFIADAKAIEKGDSASFAEMLVGSFAGSLHENPSLSFFYSPIKRRLHMITNTKSKKRSWPGMIYTPMVTLLVILAMLSFTTTVPQVNDQTKPAPKKSSAAEQKPRVTMTSDSSNVLTMENNGKLVGKFKITKTDKGVNLTRL